MNNKKRIFFGFSLWFVVTPIKASDQLSNEDLKEDVQSSAINRFLKDFKRSKFKELGIEDSLEEQDREWKRLEDSFEKWSRELNCLYEQLCSLELFPKKLFENFEEVFKKNDELFKAAIGMAKIYKEIGKDLKEKDTYLKEEQEALKDAEAAIERTEDLVENLRGFVNKSM